MIITKKLICAIIAIPFNLILCSNFSFAETPQNKKILSLEDVKIYKQIFSVQKKSIKNKKSKEWIKVDSLIKKLKNKVLLGNVYAERYLHPTGWRSSYRDLRIWLEKYNDHPDATRITRIALKRKPKNYKNPKKPTAGFLNGYGTYKANSLFFIINAAVEGIICKTPIAFEELFALGLKPDSCRAIA